MKAKQSVVGTVITAKLRDRIPKHHDLETLTDDEILMMEALHCIESLRWIDPQTVEAEAIVREAAEYLKKN